MPDIEKLRDAILVERKKQREHGLELDAADVIEVVQTWLANEPTAIDALEYMAAWCRSHKQLTFYSEAYLAAFDTIRVHAEAAVARLKRGERMEATTPVCEDS